MGNEFRHKIVIEVEGDGLNFNGKVVEETVDDETPIHEVTAVNYTLLHTLTSYFYRFLEEDNPTGINHKLMALVSIALDQTMHEHLENLNENGIKCNCLEPDGVKFIQFKESSNPFGLLN